MFKLIWIVGAFVYIKLLLTDFILGLIKILNLDLTGFEPVRTSLLFIKSGSRSTVYCWELKEYVRAVVL